jgi:uncharacterized protein
MLRVDLVRLRREGTILVEARVPSEDRLWEGSGLPWAGDVDLHLSAGYSGTGEVVVRGRVRAPLAQDCRRCLEPVSSDFVGDITLVFVAGEGDGDVGDEDTYGFGPDGELELSEAVREELILTVNPYAVCDPECKGLCGTCGANLNETSCDCSDEATDPRWDALRVLKDK